MAKSAPVELSKLLQSDEVAGRIIRLATYAEFRLDLLLAHYFTAESEKWEFFEHVVTRLSFSVKVDVLSKLDFGKPFASHTNLIRSLRGLGFLRNKLAHSYYLGDAKIDKIEAQKESLKFVCDYPKGMGKEKNAMENRFSHLWNAIDAKRKASNYRFKPTVSPPLRSGEPAA